MTPEQIEQHRKRFEELIILSDYYDEQSIEKCIHEESEYYYEDVQNRWIGYLMHAENIEVEIMEIGLADDWSCPEVQDGWELALRGVRSKLESQGIKVKP